MSEIKIYTAGDSSLLIEFEQKISPEINAQITAVVRLIKAQQIEGVTDMIPAFASLLINYDPRVISYAGLKSRLEKRLKLEISGEASAARIFEIPVCYGGEYGPRSSEYRGPCRAFPGRSEPDPQRGRIISSICWDSCRASLIWAGWMSASIRPALANPRIRIPAGSVGIGGSQTGIYPLDSPGGWQLLGMTPVKTYDRTGRSRSSLRRATTSALSRYRKRNIWTLRNRWTKAPIRAPSIRRRCDPWVFVF